MCSGCDADGKGIGLRGHAATRQANRGVQWLGHPRVVPQRRHHAGAGDVGGGGEPPPHLHERHALRPRQDAGVPGPLRHVGHLGPRPGLIIKCSGVVTSAVILYKLMYCSIVVLPSPAGCFYQVL